MSAEELLRAIAIANTVCRHTGHAPEGTATLMRCGGWTYVGRCANCALIFIHHAHPYGGDTGGDHEAAAG